MLRSQRTIFAPNAYGQGVGEREVADMSFDWGAVKSMDKFSFGVGSQLAGLAVSLPITRFPEPDPPRNVS